MENNKTSLVTLPGAIIIAGTIIAVAIIFVNRPVQNNNLIDNTKSTNETKQINLSPVTAEDHILGNPNAPIKIVEYSDPSCGYCKIFNSTMTEIMDQYGPTGKVAWVYRHFPLDKPDQSGYVLHPNAGNESRALFCISTLGGNNKFWEYQKQFYVMTPSVTSQTPQGLDQKQIPILAKEIGINTVSLAECMNSQEAKDKVSADYLSGINAGVSGTPASFVLFDKTIDPTTISYISNALVQYRIPEDLLFVSADQRVISMSGAMPKALVVGLIESLLK